jgi:hypothetical protein
MCRKDLRKTMIPAGETSFAAVQKEDGREQALCRRTYSPAETWQIPVDRAEAAFFFHHSHNHYFTSPEPGADAAAGGLRVAEIVPDMGEPRPDLRQRRE